jgi:hypothetical protein
MPKRRVRFDAVRAEGIDPKVTAGAAWAARAEKLRLDPELDGVPFTRLPEIVYQEVCRASLDLTNLVLVAVSHRRLCDRWLRLPRTRREFICSRSLPPEGVRLTGADVLAVDSARDMWAGFLRSVTGSRSQRKKEAALTRRQKKQRWERQQRRAAMFCLGGISTGIPSDIWGVICQYIGAAPLATVYASSELGALAGLPRVPRPVLCQAEICEGDGILRLEDAGTVETLKAMTGMDRCRICAEGHKLCDRHKYWDRGGCEACNDENEALRDEDRDDWNEFAGYYDPYDGHYDPYDR